MKIKTQLTLGLLLISLLSLITISIFYYHFARKSLEAHIRDELKFIASKQEITLENIFDNNLDGLKLVSSRTQLRLVLDKFNKDPKPEYQAKMNRILLDARSAVGGFQKIFVMNLNGKIVASTQKDAIGSNRSRETYFIEGLNKYCANIFIPSEELMGFLSGPLYLKDKEIGVLTIEYKAKNILKLIKDYSGLGQTGESYIAQKVNDSPPRLITPLRHSSQKDMVLETTADSLLRLAVSRKKQQALEAVDYRGKSVLAITNYIEGPKLWLIVKVDKDEALRPVAELRDVLIVVILTTTISVISFSLYFSRSITIPIVNLTKLVKSFEKGELSLRAKIKANEEIELLAESFNKMTASLANAQNSLAKKVEQLHREIIERKRAEEEIKVRQREVEALNVNLERRVKEELEKSRHKDIMLMEQSRQASIGRMIGYIAHQWRQPLNNLNIILYNIKLLLSDSGLTKETYNGLFVRSEQIVDKMSSIIDDFRYFFRPDKKKVKFSINKTIKNTLSLVDASMNYNFISVEVSEKEKITAIGFPSEYSLVILNILDNAKDAIVSRKIKGRIKIDVLLENGFGVVKIQDNGGGIEKDVLNNIFKPYFTTKEKGRGFGFGLYQCELIVEKYMNGHIEVQNIHNGTEFKVIVPRA